MLARARAARSLAAECDALNGASHALFFAQRPEESAARAREGVEAAAREGSPLRQAEGRARLALPLVVEARLDEAASALDAVIASVIASARASGAASALGTGLWYRGFVHYWKSEYAAAEALSAEGALVAEELGDGFDALGARMFEGLARANLGRVSEALATFEQALSLAERNRDPFWGPRLVAHLGWVHRELQDPEGAHALDTRALRAARDTPSPWAPEAEALVGLAVDDVRAGRPHRAAELLAALESGARPSSWMGWMSRLRLEAAAAEHCAASGDFGAAEAHAARLLQTARSLGARTYCCAAERVRAEAALHSGADVEPAAVRLTAALAEFEAFPAPLEAWKSARILGLARERLGDRAGAQRAFETAARAIRTIADGTHDEELRNGFLNSPMVRSCTEYGRRN
jgi:tetratricopeptide (TPR) repeat protein